MILNVGWIFQLKHIYLFEFLICLNRANFSGKSMVLNTKEAPKLVSLGDLRGKTDINFDRASGPFFLLAIYTCRFPKSHLLLITNKCARIKHKQKTNTLMSLLL